MSAPRFCAEMATSRCESASNCRLARCHATAAVAIQDGRPRRDRQEPRRPSVERDGGSNVRGGSIVNTPENMESWIQHPRAINARTAMPDTGVTKIDARDITAYIHTLR
jgi:cytochrome c1